MTQLHLQPEADDIPCRCENCDATMPASELVMVTDIEERISPGCIVPAGQCPHCHGLAYYEDASAPSWTAQAIGYRLLAEAGVTKTALQKAESALVGAYGEPVAGASLQSATGVDAIIAVQFALSGAPADEVAVNANG
ncbi:hypothetical protein J2X65_003532 [Ancylobacter sp. 3268]|uniref:hypothetical protein n=1 Tax=Ancylobacter sp. 3268 TaxID=2817752 RepID=UPI00285899BE|nr:hypothetical protein [Ancylobacter sp. 3268]MDR6954164.1 hypothetical protein [Ancylobacter sp. 3268]